jgi:imidazolonepropionase-like amidohydrolase
MDTDLKNYRYMKMSYSKMLRSGRMRLKESSPLSDLIIKNGKIVQVGKNLSCADCKIVDAAGKHLTAGIIDEHTHIALRGVNEGSKSNPKPQTPNPSLNSFCRKTKSNLF